MDIKSIIAKSKQKKFLGEGDAAVRGFIDAKVQDMVAKVLEEMIPKMLEEATEIVKEEICELTKNVKKGDPGYTPKKDVDYFDGEDGDDGKDYVLTAKDKKEIASQIKVPIVERIIEKREILKPTTTEVAIHETAEEIATKLNTLEEKVDIKVIKGLSKWLANIASAIREKSGGGHGGGGMGDVLHEQFTGDGVTTSFTLSSNVAAGGNAVMACRYEGQVQYLGDQFTISGRTLSMTFTPALGTKIEITYIRT